MTWNELLKLLFVTKYNCISIDESFIYGSKKNFNVIYYGYSEILTLPESSFIP